jgi:hypothetical protein
VRHLTIEDKRGNKKDKNDDKDSGDDDDAVVLLRCRLEISVAIPEDGDFFENALTEGTLRGKLVSFFERLESDVLFASRVGAGIILRPVPVDEDATQLQIEAAVAPRVVPALYCENGVFATDGM